jgi:hypothetical protein
MADFLFTTREGLQGDALEALGGGISALAGIYAWDKLMGPLESLMGKIPLLGQYAKPVTGFILALLLLHISRSQEGMLGRFLQVASYGLFGDSIAKVFNIDPPTPAQTPQGTIAFTNPWSTLEPVPLPR